MNTESIRPQNPEANDFIGNAPARSFKRFLHATRPKFFPASALPVLVGTAWGVAASGQFNGVVFLLALLATVCVHAGCNVLNDVGDDSGGTDARNEQRIYPYTGGSRFIQTGILDSPAMLRLGLALLAIASIVGVLLIAMKGIVVLYFGLAGILLGIVYSLGPVRLNAVGLGELAVGIAFGILPVAGAAWLQGATIDSQLLLFAVPVGAWGAAILLINEVPDIDADGSTGKRTLAVRLGLTGTAWLFLAIQVTAAACVALVTARGGLPLLAPLVPALLLVLAWRASAAIKVGVSNREQMALAIESTLAIHTIGCVWLIGCTLFLFWW